MDLNERQRRFVVAAHQVAPNKGDRFKWREVGKAAGFSEGESDDLARELSGTTPPVMNRLPNYEGVLAHGRELARLYSERDEAERLKRREEVIWRAAKGLWAVLVSVVSLVIVPLWVNKLDRQYERMEEEQHKQELLPAPTLPTTLAAPTTTVTGGTDYGLDE